MWQPDSVLFVAVIYQCSQYSSFGHIPKLNVEWPPLTIFAKGPCGSYGFILFSG